MVPVHLGLSLLVLSIAANAASVPITGLWPRQTAAVDILTISVEISGGFLVLSIVKGR